jgi:glycosyltransferase involved in cell wall biosynthesis
MVARLDPIKNLPTLLTAMAEVRQQQSGAHLLIVGDGPLRESLQQQATALNLETAVHFLGTRHDVPDLLAASDVLALPSLSEGLSMTLIEGSAAGLPLVASDVGGNNELVEHGTNGLLVPVSNAGALAKALITIITDKAKADQMGKASRQRFHQYFQVGAMVTHYQALYEVHPSERRDTS